MRDMPSLVGIERIRFEDNAWASAMFTWAVRELYTTVDMAIAGTVPWETAEAHADAIDFQLQNWEPNQLH